VANLSKCEDDNCFHDPFPNILLCDGAETTEIAQPFERFWAAKIINNTESHCLNSQKQLPFEFWSSLFK
jgi:hypothetical protein